MENNNEMNNQQIEQQLCCTMEDCDYLTDILNTEKYISSITCTAISEASNEVLYNEIMNMFTEVKSLARKTFDLLYKNGWYPVERAEDNKIQQKVTEFNEKLSQQQY